MRQAKSDNNYNKAIQVVKMLTLEQLYIPSHNEHNCTIRAVLEHLKLYYTKQP